VCSSDLAASRCNRNGGAEFLMTRFHDLAACWDFGRGPLRFDGILMIEILQYFPDPEEAFRLCQKCAAPDGLLFIDDVTATRALPWARVPFHREKALRDAAEAAGWQNLLFEDVTDRVIPTLDRLARGMEEARSSAVSFFAGKRPRIDAEIDELMLQWRNLEAAFQNKDLAYVTAVFRGRDGED